MARVTLLTMSDGRDFVARDLTGFCREAEAPAGLAPPSRTRRSSTIGSRRSLTHFTMPAASATSGPLLLLRAASAFLGIIFEPLGCRQVSQEGSHSP